MANYYARRHRDALSAAAIVFASLALASCASQPTAKPQATSPAPAATAPTYASPDAAIRAVLADSSGVLSIAAPATREALLASYSQAGFAPMWLASDTLSPRGGQLARALTKAAAAGSPSSCTPWR